jgi:hypothetical protein
MFQKILLGVLLAACAVLGGQQAKADQYVRGYIRSNGTYVSPYHRSSPDHSFYNNWSTYPNINPYTGRMGTRLTPSYSPNTGHPSYHAPRASSGYGRSR